MGKCMNKMKIFPSGHRGAESSTGRKGKHSVPTFQEQTSIYPANRRAQEAVRGRKQGRSFEGLLSWSNLQLPPGLTILFNVEQGNFIQ